MPLLPLNLRRPQGPGQAGQDAQGKAGSSLRSLAKMGLGATRQTGLLDRPPWGLMTHVVCP